MITFSDGLQKKAIIMHEKNILQSNMANTVTETMCVKLY